MHKVEKKANLSFYLPENTMTTYIGSFGRKINSDSQSVSRHRLQMKLGKAVVLDFCCSV